GQAGNAKTLRVSRVLAQRRVAEVAPVSQGIRVGVAGAEVSRVINDVLCPVDVDAEFGRVTPEQVRQVVHKLQAALVGQCRAFEEAGAPEREAAEEDWRRGFVGELESPVSPPLKAGFVNQVGAQRRGQAGVEALNAYVVRAVTPDIAEHERRLNAVQ